MTHHLFSTELFSDTRLSQQQTGGVLLHIEDWLAGVQRSSRQKKPLKRSIKMNMNMQNKPNLRNDQMNTNSVPTRDYRNEMPRGRGQNKANTKPIKPNSNPKQSHF